MSCALSEQDYHKFIDVYGNKYNRQHFIAIRFKRAIITYHCTEFDTTPIDPPNDSIVVLRGSYCPDIQLDNKCILLYTIGKNVIKGGIRVPDQAPNTLLRALIPEDQTKVCEFYHSTLYVIASENPFPKITKTCKKNKAFRALVTFVEATKKNRILTLEEAASIRFFKRHCQKLNNFNRWSPFALNIVYKKFYSLTHALPTSHIGKQLFRLLKRSKKAPEYIIDSDFYRCEVFFTDIEPVGVMCLFEADKLKYVSPMVVKETSEKFRDTNYIECNTWLPLYKDKQTWNDYCLPFYVHDLSKKKIQLKQVLLWLQNSTVEKYQLLYKDLEQIGKILFDE